MIDGEIPHFLKNREIQLRGKFQKNFSMRKIAWFRAGGDAEMMFQPQDVDDLTAFLTLLPRSLPLTVVGLGSNLLVRDAGIKGMVLRLSHAGFGQAKVTNDFKIIAGASCSGKFLANLAVKHGIGGFHFFYGIPGSVGGAAYMNAGSNNYETAELVIEVHVMDRMGNKHVISRNDMGYGYRCSKLPQDMIITQVVFQGFPEKQNIIVSAMKDVMHHRETVQPTREKTGGSTFKNPVGYSAWKLIADSHCRGLVFGGAKISELHCNFMINMGNATGYELEYLGEKVRKKVFDTSGVLLEWEIRRMGEFLDHQIIKCASIT
ncbi:MAG: UDP-N-acetylmuramate dehydrogenase [Candidatus Liberibacter ctenarytainae]|uniref:UDP-N-acetylenolpyruvoylglucosamine reductase n=1 Tax=Candidatus Liberibacter ctenarytainae TaxID=2020335 RepID=A0A937DM74_9HYPH|nr:UDP-N-acetylmuramate dehydrogenase [Candidatus Liberibacter ctenarytainae]